ncbi:MAG: hypothetical protein LBB85_11690 [Dysgonamonadaceae bacterium]|jgi:hypothetical protein|nr:hypothetical protein [Dysgonamonadaceae bacterium]
MNKLATHNSLSGYRVKTWWLRPFNFLSKCQDKTLEEQYASGARSFDLRFAKYRGEWYAAHGAMVYEITLSQAIRKLASLPCPVYFRVLCEDTFYRQSDAKELSMRISEEINELSGLTPLYVQSKRTWEVVVEYAGNRECANFDLWSFTENDRDSLCTKVAQMYELQTTDDKINFIGCYESAGVPWLFGLPLPRLAARALTPIALKKQWKENDCPVVDFI